MTSHHGTKIGTKVKRADAFKIAEWIKTNKEQNTTISIKVAATKCSADLGVPVGHVAFKNILRDLELKWPGPKIHNNLKKYNLSRDRTRFLARQFIALYVLMEQHGEAYGIPFDPDKLIHLDALQHINRMGTLPEDTDMDDEDDPVDDAEPCSTNQQELSATTASSTPSN